MLDTGRVNMMWEAVLHGALESPKALTQGLRVASGPQLALMAWAPSGVFH